MTLGLKFAVVVTAVTTLIVSGILLAAAMKDIKMANSQAALTQINMTHQVITSAEVKLNTTIICNNINNVGYCQAPLLQYLK
jgi:hypothetical protein